MTWGELESLAEKARVLDLYNIALSQIRPLFDSVNRSQSSISLVGYMGPNKSRQGFISIFPGASSPEIGLAVGLKVDQLCEYFGVEEGILQTAIGDPDPKAKSQIDPFIYSGSYWLPSYGLDEAKLNGLVDLLMTAAEKA